MVIEIEQWKMKLKSMVILTGMKRNLLKSSSDAHLFPAKFIKQGLDWIRQIGTILIDCNKIRRMCTEDQWASYKALSGLDTNGLPEVVQMNTALTKLRKAISDKNRPDFFKREAQRVEAKKIKKT